jgi:CheY-like chemotaxis protein
VQRVLRPRRLSGVLTLKVDIAKTELNRSRLGDITATAQFLMDFQMPEMDGSKATQLIQALELKENRPYIPVIALTAGQRPRQPSP